VSTAKSSHKPAPAKASEALQDLRPETQVTETKVEAQAPKAKAARKSRDQLYAKYTPVREDVITLVPGGKAKTGKGLAIAKFALYGEGNITVGEVLDKCKGDNRAMFNGKPLKPSIRWDWAHNLIQINGKAYAA
jgi:hypothetical protein